MKRDQRLWIVLGCAVLLLAGCGGDGAAMAGEEGGEGAAARAETAAVPETPEDLGKAIGAVYVEGIEGTVKLLEGRPPAAEAAPRVAELKEELIQKLLVLGRQREALVASERGTVDSATRMAINRLPSATFTAYAEAQNHYRKSDRELGEMIASFNILTQYAAFELLREQAPDEATRLGL